MTCTTRQTLSLQQAVAQAPALAQLHALAGQSAERLAIIRPLLPPALRLLVKPGAPEGDTWCLLVPHSAAATKLRQLTPALLAALAQASHPVQTLRIKVEKRLHGQ